MKKTIVALMALSGVAFAATEATQSIWSTNFSVNTTDGVWNTAGEDVTLITSSDWGLTAADGSELSSTTKNSAELRPDTNVGQGNSWSLSFDLTNNSSTDSLTIGSLTFDTLIFAGGGDYQTVNRDFVFTLTIGDQTVTSGNWTIIGNGTASPENGVVTLSFTEGIVLEASESTDVTLTVEKGTTNAGCYIGLKSISASSEVVPEPTTATLSLLALAGLAVRRRR